MDCMDFHERDVFTELLGRLNAAQLAHVHTQAILSAAAYPQRQRYRDALALIEAELTRRNPEGLHAA